MTIRPVDGQTSQKNGNKKMSALLVLFLMAACVVLFFSISGAAIWWAGRLPVASEKAGLAAQGQPKA
ncbi:hypothetical protein [Salipiger aestuarii]|uniref:hypothetical protein n=1 Tax=Salipiger aestuarii TaxID=568098 RepID=UPI001681B1E2|nr:hypothetical protein [Salipiger aestuarii]